MSFLDNIDKSMQNESTNRLKAGFINDELICDIDDLKHRVWWRYTAWVCIGCTVKKLSDYKYMWE
jgi:hypothetical protein